VIHRRKLWEVCDGFGGGASGGFFSVGFAGFGAAERGCGSGAQAFGFGGDLRGWHAAGRRAYGRRGVADGARLGVLRFNARGPEGLIGGKAPGKLALLKAVQREALAKVVEAGPEPTLHGVVRWRIADLVAWLQGTFEVTVSPQT